MQFEHQIGAALELPGHPFGGDDRTATRRPANEVPFRLLRAHRAHPVEPRLPVGPVETTRCGCAIEVEHSVMHGSIPRLELDSPNEAISRKGYPHHEISEDVFLLWLQHVRTRRLHDHVGCSKLPGRAE